MREGLGEGGTLIDNQGNCAQSALSLGQHPTPSSILPLKWGGGAPAVAILVKVESLHFSLGASFKTSILSRL